jgi:hypothetical protein
MAPEIWQAWLKEFNAELLANIDEAYALNLVAPDVTPEVIASGWLGFPSATEEQLAQLEAQLGVKLPPSYRNFLETSNGFSLPGNNVPRLFSTTEIVWFRDSHPEVIDIWVGIMEETKRDLPQVFEKRKDPFEQYLSATLQISEMEYAGTAVYLLNPQIVNNDGEWEAFLFDHTIPGVERYFSFWALMNAERESL